MTAAYTEAKCENEIRVCARGTCMFTLEHTGEGALYVKTKSEKPTKYKNDSKVFFPTILPLYPGTHID